MASRSRGRGATPLQQELGNRIRARRHELGLTQAGLAFEAGVHYSYIGALENGVRNPSIDLIARLAKAMEVDLGLLLEGLQDFTGRSGTP